jgi:5-methylthioadenosine/S-adenosylhomocysteine deaminase
MIADGIPKGLGTHNSNTNNTTIINREMTVAALLHKGVHEDPAVIDAASVLDMATIGGAQAAGLDQRVGSIEPGKRADLVLVDADRPNMTPLHDPVSALVYQTTGAEVDTVIVDGEILLHQGVLTRMTAAEESGLRHEAQLRSRDILRRTGLLA